jgi:prevent-host-death family protein
MRTVNMHDAKSQLSKLVEAVESGETDEVVIARNGRPAARLVPMTSAVRTPCGSASPRGYSWLRPIRKLRTPRWRRLFLESRD